MRRSPASLSALCNDRCCQGSRVSQHTLPFQINHFTLKSSARRRRRDHQPSVNFGRQICAQITRRSPQSEKSFLLIIRRKEKMQAQIAAAKPPASHWSPAVPPALTLMRRERFCYNSICGGADIDRMDPSGSCVVELQRETLSPLPPSRCLPHHTESQS